MIGLWLVACAHRVPDGWEEGSAGGYRVASPPAATAPELGVPAPPATLQPGDPGLDPAGCAAPAPDAEVVRTSWHKLGRAWWCETAESRAGQGGVHERYQVTRRLPTGVAVLALSIDRPAEGASLEERWASDEELAPLWTMARSVRPARRADDPAAQPSSPSSSEPAPTP